MNSQFLYTKFLDLAIAYKDDGNFNFKLKKYRFAIANYTEGLKQKCGKAEVDAALYLNRAAAHFYLGNYRLTNYPCYFNQTFQYFLLLGRR